MSRRTAASAAPGIFAFAATGAFRFALVLAALPLAARAETKFALQLHREPQFEFAGYYAALWQGFYQAAGLDVEIKPGSPPGAISIDPVREVIEGRAQFGTGAVQLLFRAAQGHSLLLLAPWFQQSGAAIYYRAESDFSAPLALLGARVGRMPANNVLELEFRSALYDQGIDPERMKSVSLEPGQAIEDLVSRRVDAAVGSAWELPWQARERGLALKSLSLTSDAAEFYGDGLFTLQRLAKADPLLVRRFREASLKGWEYAMQRPDEVASRILAKLPLQVPASDPIGFVRYQTEVARKLARYPDVPLGNSNQQRWAQIHQSLIKIGVISRPVDLSAFLYEPATGAGQRSDSRLAVVLTATGVLALFVAGLLWRRPRWRAAVTWGRGGTSDGKPVRTPTFRAAMRRTHADRLAPLFNRSRVSFKRWTQRLRRGLSVGVARWGSIASGPLQRLMAVLESILSKKGVAPKPRPTDLNVTLETIEQSLRRRLPRSIDCRLSLAPELWLCLADANEVAAVLRDLVAAAVADMPAGGDLIVGTRQFAIDAAAVAEWATGAAGDYVRLTVKDNGAGLSAVRLEGIFDPAATVRPAVAAAHELALRFGGFARVESVEGIGTAVHLYFRRADSDDDSAQPSRGEAASARAAAA